MSEYYATGQMSDEEIRTAYARCFQTREGRIVLSHLRRITLERYLGPDSSSEELRHMEGQRHLVSAVLALSGNR